MRRRGLPALRWTNADDQTFGPIIRQMAEAGRAHLGLTLALAAARAQLFETAPDTDVILCDRFVASSLVYQVYAGVPADYILAVNAPFLHRVTTIMLEIDASTLEARRRERAVQKGDWFKRSMPVGEELRLYRAARELLEAHGSLPIVVDASKSLEHTQAELGRALVEILPEKP